MTMQTSREARMDRTLFMERRDTGRRGVVAGLLAGVAELRNRTGDTEAGKRC
jgi:hypothetical protein